MIEQAIYFALGCCVTGLLALLFAPVYWQRALRLTRQRLQLQVPLSMQEILAERDQLRAQFAVERLRVEQTCEAVQSAKGRDMAEIGRRTMEIAALTEEIQTLKETVAIQTKSIEDAHSSRDDRAKQLDTLNVSLQENSTKLAEYRRRAETAETERSRLLSETDSHRTTIASLKTVGMSLEIRLADAERALATEREGAGALRSRLETAMEHSARHESAGLLIRRELDDAKIQRRQVEADLAAAQTAVKTLRDERDRALGAHEGSLEDHDKTTRSLKNDLDDSRRRAGKALAELEAVKTELYKARTQEEATKDKLLAAAEQDAALAQVRRELEETTAQVNRLQDDLQTAGAAPKAETPGGEEGDIEHVAALAALQTEHRTLVARFEEVETRVAAAETARDAALRELAALKDRQEATPSTRQQLEEANARARQLQNELGAAQAGLAEALRERQALSDGHSALQAEVTSSGLLMRRELDDAKAQIAKLDEKLLQANVLLGEARETVEQHRLRATADRALDGTALAEAQTNSGRLTEELARAQKELAEARATLNTVGEREKAAALQRSLQSDKERRAEARLKEQMDALASENDALKHALAEAERQTGTSVSPAAGPDEGGLRASIHALGLAVAQLTRDSQETSIDDRRRPRKDEKTRPIGVA